MKWNILIILIICIILSKSTWVRRTFKFTQFKQYDGWLFLQKFKFEAGIAKFDVQVYLRGKGKSKSHEIYIQGYNSQRWQNESKLRCNSSLKMPVMMNQLKMTGQKDIDIFQFSVQKDDIYYFVVKDCLKMFRKDYDNQNLILYVNLRPYRNNVEFDIQQDQKKQKHQKHQEKQHQDQTISIQDNREEEQVVKEINQIQSNNSQDVQRQNNQQKIDKIQNQL